ncbi:tRNA (adenosine(37)-N6)-threonylcarbamoyltransferase complex transferase subunit TsaD [uncultured Hyphomicrobium sp.]|uniref:tRNA (adenosine(37)-N6)-threonylcarbamoyltransferase complex transferase subunit TsaD n=1 Tax=uncultured Hyphomicrobium sp. TaxID=194373 RepID=UPI0025F88922|nr:tRNA (adenosine(37)-N6)-threonylcarbamoyltransferase complex transferase subunit TsaD [uncultured Hyphomicrobium sp.]
MTSSKDQVILGIESSCDDTAAAVVDEAGRVLSSVVVSQVEIHAAHGGVFPEMASRAHVTAMVPCITKALADAGVTQRDLRAIGVTRGPGLIGPLLVGLNAAAGVGLGWGVPVIGVNHLRGHLRSADLDEQRVRFPALLLLVSGGHTLLAHMATAHDVRILGSTRDDSVGEAYDKVGRLMGLGYPAGAKVDRLAATGDGSHLRLPRPMIADGLDFSFSGLKSAMSKYFPLDGAYRLEDLAASFVDACMDVLIEKSRRALAAHPSRSLVVVGGVAASPQLRSAAQTLCAEMGVELCLPPLRWSTDNAAMIALAAWDYLSLETAPRPIAQPNLRVDQW